MGQTPKAVLYLPLVGEVSESSLLPANLVRTRGVDYPEPSSGTLKPLSFVFLLHQLSQLFCKILVSLSNLTGKLFLTINWSSSLGISERVG